MDGSSSRGYVESWEGDSGSPFIYILEVEKTERFSHVPACEFLLPCNDVIVLLGERGISGDF
jgi:hypothetical protein